MTLDIADVRRLGLSVFERRRERMNPRLAKSLGRLAQAEEWSEFSALVISEALRAGDLQPVETEKARALERAGLLAERLSLDSSG